MNVYSVILPHFRELVSTRGWQTSTGTECLSLLAQTVQRVSDPCFQPCVNMFLQYWQQKHIPDTIWTKSTTRYLQCMGVNLAVRPFSLHWQMDFNVHLDAAKRNSSHEGHAHDYKNTQTEIYRRSFQNRPTPPLYSLRWSTERSESNIVDSDAFTSGKWRPIHRVQSAWMNE